MKPCKKLDDLKGFAFQWELAKRVFLLQGGNVEDEDTKHKLFYSIKTVICILLDRQLCFEKLPWDSYKGETIGGMYYWDIHNFFNGSYSVMEWSEVVVGKGVLKNWYYSIEYNYSC